ncbi:MAG TPA: hypothetical protein VGF59_27290 [Bryobacteraceae bacterium]
MFRRLPFLAALLGSSALAAPPLSTIQDVLYKADGSRFNGTITISWNSFEAIDGSAIATQVTTVRVIDGNLRVQLVPTTTSTPPASYQVKYNSDGRIQFEETWIVPSSSKPLRVRDVRTTPQNAADTGGTTTIQESDVVGLIADLGARPLKGPGFAAGRVAVVNPLGALESVSGIPTDCVRVDGSSGPCGAQPPSFVDADAPAGIVDGSNTLFTLSAIPDPVASLAVYRNGLLQKIGQDYTLNGSAIQFVAEAAPQAGDTLLASYRLSGGDSSAPLMYPSPQVLCSGTGAATGSVALASVGTCAIPAGVLAAGDSIDIRYDLEHQGTASGFSFEVHWGGTTIAHRDAAASDVLATGRASAGIVNGGARLSFQSWGTVLPFAAGVASAADSWIGGLTIDFQAKMAQAGDTVTLRTYSVVRLP